MPRHRSRWIAAAVVLLATLATSPTAQSAYMLEFGRSNYTAMANGTVTVSVFLRETVTANLMSQGLIAGDVRLLFNEPTRVVQPAQLFARIMNPGFDSPAPSQPAIVAATATTSGIADIIQSSFEPVKAPVATPDLVLLGQFTFQVGATVGVLTQLRATDQSPTADGLVLADGTVIDAQTAAGTATITADVPVPEPAGITMLASAVPMAWLLMSLRRND